MNLFQNNQNKNRLHEGCDAEDVEIYISKYKLPGLAFCVFVDVNEY